MSPLPKFEFEDTITPEDKVDKEALQTTLQKLNELNFKDVQFGSIRPGAGSVIDGDLLVEGTVGAAKIIAGSITANEIKSGTITASEIASRTITASRIASGAITANEIASNTITANQIKSDTITANQMDVSQLSAISANIGSITAGSITGITITGGTIRTSSSSTRVEMSGSSNTLRHYQDGNIRTQVANGQISFNRPDGVFSGAVFGFGSQTLGINVGGDGSYQFNPTQFLSPSGGTVNLGDPSNKFESLFLSDDIDIGGVVRSHLNPQSDNNSSIGTTTRRWRDIRFRNQLVGHGTTSSRSFILPSSADTCNIGSPSLYFHQVFADRVRYKDLASFDHIDDLEAIKAVNIKTIEREGPDDIDSEGNVIRGKKYKKDVWDTKTLPKDVVEGEFIDANAMNGLVIGSLKELINKVEQLENKVNGVV